MKKQVADSSSPIQAAREALGLSREGLAYKAGVSLRTIERIETGATEPQRSTLAVIERALAETSSLKERVG